LTFYIYRKHLQKNSTQYKYYLNRLYVKKGKRQRHIALK